MIDHTALPHYRYPHHLLFFLCFILSLPFTTITAVSGASATTTTPHFREAPKFYNSPACASMPSNSNPCSKDLIHVAMTLDATYLRGTMAAIFSILQHSSCPESIHFHLITAATTTQLSRRIATSFPYLRFTTYEFNTSPVSGLISTSIRPALDNPLNYARNYLPDLLPTCVTRVVYLDSDIILVDDIQILAATPIPNPYVLAAPEYCNADFKSYFTPTFWANPSLSMALFEGRIGSPCYFNTGVMVIDLSRWRAEECTRKIVEYMELQKRIRIYELGSLPPFLLAFAGNVATVDHRWNQHGLGGDNYLGICRELHPGPVSLLHWSGKGKPWVRLDENRPCPLDTLWVPYDLLEKKQLVDLDP